MITNFYYTQKSWTKEECFFRLMSYSKKGQPKLICERKIDMSSFIGHYNAVCDIDLGKGIILKTSWNIIPACPKLHEALISKEKKQMAKKEESVKKEEIVKKEEVEDSVEPQE